jgi:hypothetical protein
MRFSSRRKPGLRKKAPVKPATRPWWSATRTLSSAVSSLKRRMFWKVRAMPLMQIWCGRRPLTRSPSTKTSPEVGG